jgi:16S rRNA (cytidine1402-2'-O)-methyltransferase
MKNPRSGLEPRSVTLRALGHANITGRHARTFELVREPSVSSSGTCIVGVAAEYEPQELLALRGSVRIDLACGSAHDTVAAEINPFYIESDPLIVRIHPQPQHRSFCIGADKGAADLSPDLIAALQRPGGELEMTVTETAQTVRGALFLVGMPIGNRLDLSPRAMSTLRSADLIMAEDTRTAAQFFGQNLGPVRGKLVSCHDHNERARAAEVLAALADGGRVALVSEAGMPLISDPGYVLVREAVQAGMLVTSVPGPDAVTTALSLAGLPASDFRFIGFLPSSAGQLERALGSIADAPYTSVMFEAPHRLIKTLERVSALFGSRPIAACRNLTMPGEEAFRGTADEVAKRISASDAERGQFVLVIAPAERTVTEGLDATMRALAHQLLEDGVPTKTVAKAITKATGGKRRDAFQAILDLKDALDPG